MTLRNAPSCPFPPADAFAENKGFSLAICVTFVTFGAASGPAGGANRAAC
jgi:hypothetical protein